MAVTYTTAALVKKRIENYDTSLSDTDIEAYINDAEQTLNALMGTDFLGTNNTFSGTKHGILRHGATVLVALGVIGFNPAGFTDLSEAQVIAEILAYEWEQVKEQLLRREVVSYLEAIA